eukprot:9359851-Ditylum_brightwellii.AAC.1
MDRSRFVVQLYSSGAPLDTVVFSFCLSPLVSAMQVLRLAWSGCPPVGLGGVVSSGGTLLYVSSLNIPEMS